jgi:hypothetical protein
MEEEVVLDFINLFRYMLVILNIGVVSDIIASAILTQKSRVMAQVIDQNHQVQAPYKKTGTLVILCT